jgi:hypothetical protein
MAKIDMNTRSAQHPVDSPLEGSGFELSGPAALFASKETFYITGSNYIHRQPAFSAERGAADLAVAMERRCVGMAAHCAPRQSVEEIDGA